MLTGVLSARSRLGKEQDVFVCWEGAAVMLMFKTQLSGGGLGWSYLESSTMLVLTSMGGGSRRIVSRQSDRH